jgi:type IV pilus biogenesis protein CpaD/CtpE
MKPAIRAILTMSVAALACLIAQGCASTHHAGKPVKDASLKEFDDFGVSVRQDIAAQILNPNPTFKHATTISDGKRACLAERRYQVDAVVPPQLATTQSGQQLLSGGGVTTANLSAGCGGVPLEKNPQ